MMKCHNRTDWFGLDMELDIVDHGNIYIKTFNWIVSYIYLQSYCHSVLPL